MAKEKIEKVEEAVSVQKEKILKIIEIYKLKNPVKAAAKEAEFKKLLANL